MKLPAALIPRKPTSKLERVVYPIIAYVLVGCFFLAVPIYVFIPPIVKEWLNRRPFSSDIWKKSGKPYAVNELRLQMVDDLIKSRVLEGRNRDEVVEILGETDGDPSAKKRFSEWHMHYYIGPSRGTVLFKGFNFDYFVLRFDDQGKVVAMDIVTLKT